ncbi:GH36-type glycosyl hydrolase domain-containing protein [Adhaeretor mobilis]|uniref:N,N'-diacetylchitobiose phosphorylase n=1 Tax=Adhaeretor mobilis TaxID=1930276 RepID=A0A517MPV6_9BACT|nr:hypothetical protein [Adhaeretor mobilis]QDS96918.1 N,N'-diacetylchitobiose phosphorylase [Adhaeretor mobilis]
MPQEPITLDDNAAGRTELGQTTQARDALRSSKTPAVGDACKSPQENLQSPTSSLASELAVIRELVADCENQIQRGDARRLPGNTAFLADGRVLCRERKIGESRYPYGLEGFNFWVSATGAMHANQGLFFLFLPTPEGREPPIAFFAGCRPEDSEFIDGDLYAPHSLLPTPVIDQSEGRTVDRYTVFGHDAAYFVSETPELLTIVRVFVDQTHAQQEGQEGIASAARLHFSTHVENRTGRPLETYSSAYFNPFCRHSFGESNEDRWYKQVWVDSHEGASQTAAPSHEDSSKGHSPAAPGDIYLPSFIVRVNEELNRLQSISNFALLRRAVGMTNAITGHPVDLSMKPAKQDADAPLASGEMTAQVCTSRQAYVGARRRTLGSSKFLTQGHFEEDVPLTVFTDNAVAGDLLRFVLPPDTYLSMEYSLSMPTSEAALEEEKTVPLGLADPSAAMSRVRRKIQEPGDLKLSVVGAGPGGLAEESVNHFFGYLKKQVAICALLKGYMNPTPNSLIGIRDVFQAIEGHLFDRPLESREKILEALAYVLEDGRCPRQYSLPENGKPGRADLREYIDQGVWVVSAIHTYLAATGDASLLAEIAGYHRVSPADPLVIEESERRDTVLDHLNLIMDYLTRQRDPQTGLVLALYGDWNDAIDGLGLTTDPNEKFGTGVSVMVSLQLYQNCREMIEMLHAFGHADSEQLGSDNPVQRYRLLERQLHEGLLKHAVVRQDGESRIVHGWGDRRSYYVGSFCDPDGAARDGLTSNAYWILSDMIRTELSLREPVLAAMERLDSTYGMKTFEPGFTRADEGVGRIGKLPVGSAENGATYVHATTFAIAALFKIGESEKAWEQIHKILPFAAHHKTLSHSPFVMPNSYSENPEFNLTGQSMDDWQTGSSNVLLKLFIRYVFGFQPTLDALEIAPAEGFPFAAFEFQATAQGRRVKLCLERPAADQALQRREIYLDGKQLNLETPDELSGLRHARIPYAELSKNTVNQIRIVEPNAR